MNRLRLAGPLLVVILLGACGGGSHSASAGSVQRTDDAPTATTIVVGPDGSSTAVDVPPAGTAADDGTIESNAGGGTANPAPVDSTGPVGSFAPEILSPRRSAQIVLEVRVQSGAAPQSASVDHVSSVLGNVSQKPVSLTGGAAIPAGAQSWSADDLRALGNAGRAQGNGAAVVHLLFVHGSFGGDDSVLGVSVQGDTAAVFVDEIQSSSTPLVGYGGIEAAVVTHEVGHLLGLVDLFLHTGRQDPQHPGHSTNKASVMYWAVESNVVADLLQGGPPKDFDSADLADLAAIRSSG